MTGRERVWAALAALAFCAACGAASAEEASRVRIRVRGSTIAVRGWIVADAADTVGVDVDGNGTADRTVKSGEIESVEHDDAPPDYALAQGAFDRGEWVRALEKFREILDDRNKAKPWMASETNFAMAECYRQLGPADPANYAKAMETYDLVLKARPDGWLKPRVMLGRGECLLAGDKPAESRKHFEPLAKGAFGPLLAAKARSGLARLLRKEGKAKEAAEALAALAEETEKPFPALALDAQLARAACLMDDKSYAEARKAFQDVAASVEEKQADLKARAWNGVADAYLAEGAVKDALLAYLRVDVLYFESGAELPRALFGAAQCFETMKEGARATRLYQRIVEEFKDSDWAVKARRRLGG